MAHLPIALVLTSTYACSSGKVILILSLAVTAIATYCGGDRAIYKLSLQRHPIPLPCHIAPSIPFPSLDSCFILAIFTQFQSRLSSSINSLPPSIITQGTACEDKSTIYIPKADSCSSSCHSLVIPVLRAGALGVIRELSLVRSWNTFGRRSGSPYRSNRYNTVISNPEPF